MNKDFGRCRRGMVDVVLNGQAQTFTWKDPRTIDAAAPTQIELERAPRSFKATHRVQGGTPGPVIVSVTKTGGTITGTNFDLSTVRIEAELR